MAMTVAEAERMETARAKAGKVGGINFSYRGVALEESAAWRTPLGERGIAYDNLGTRLLALKDTVVSSARAMIVM